jgi:hypothetical protein
LRIGSGLLEPAFGFAENGIGRERSKIVFSRKKSIGHLGAVVCKIVRGCLSFSSSFSLQSFMLATVATEAGLDSLRKWRAEPGDR